MTDTTASGRSGSASSGPAGQARGLVRWLYCNNPFYVLSAGLVFFGLRASFDAHGKTFETWALMLGLTGYTLLLAGTACLLIRIGQVWDDVRTVLLLVVLMFLAVSVSFDETLAGNPPLGRLVFLGGLAFAVAVSEALLRSIRLRLPAWFRGPYYAILALFFLYPVALSPYLSRPDSPELQWGLFGFAPAAAIVFLTLLPAVRRGPDYVSKNGSPWRWPLYPWVLFGFLALGVCARAYYLCVSFHFVLRWQIIFGPYFLIPFLLALAVLLLEIGIVSRNRIAQRLALIAPMGLLVLAAIGHHRPDPLYRHFLGMFRSTLGATPLYLTLLASSGFYAYASLRRVRSALGALTAALVAFAMVSPQMLDLDSPIIPWAPPLAAAGVVQVALAVRRREHWRCLLATVLLIAATGIALPTTWSANLRLVLLAHLAIVAVLTVGAVFDDAFALFLRLLGAVLLLFASLAPMAARPESFADVPPIVIHAYPLLPLAAAVAYGWLVQGAVYYIAAGVGLSAWLLVAAQRVYIDLRRLVAGLDQIAWGLLCFLLAAFISLAKAGVWQRWWARRTGKE